MQEGIDFDSDDDGVEREDVVSKPKPRTGKGAAKAEVIDLSDDDEVPAKKPAPAKKAAPKKKKSEFSDLSGGDSDEEAEKKPSTSKKPSPKKAAPKTAEPKSKAVTDFFGASKKNGKKAAGSDDEDDESFVVAPREKRLV